MAHSSQCKQKFRWNISTHLAGNNVWIKIRAQWMRCECGVTIHLAEDEVMTPPGPIKTGNLLNISATIRLWRRMQLRAVNYADILFRVTRQHCTFFHPAAVGKFTNFKVISVDSQQPQGANWSSLRQHIVWFRCPWGHAALLHCKTNQSVVTEFQYESIILLWVTERQDTLPYALLFRLLTLI